MATAERLLLLVTLITSICSLVACVAVFWKLDSRFTQLQKWIVEQLKTPPSDTKLAEVLADQAELSSTLQKLTTTTKRLSSRRGMEDVRARSQNVPPPPGASKAEVRAYYGLTGKSGPDFARQQMNLNGSGD